MMGEIMLLSKLYRSGGGRGGGGGGGHDLPGVTVQRMLLKELLLESTDCCFSPLKQF